MNNNTFNFYGNSSMTVMCVCPPPPALEDCGLSITSIDLNIETGLTFNYTTTAEKIEVLLVIGEEAPVSLGCEDTDGTYLVPIETIGSIIGQEAYFVFNTSTDCGETICSRTVEIVTIQREIPETGANTIVPATGSLNCYGVKDFSLLYSFLTGVTLNEDTGKVTVPAQTVDGPGVVIYYKTCNLEVTSLLFLLAFNEAEPVQMYSCSGAECVADENGIYDHPSCYGNCNVGPTMYSCAEAECVEDENGIYNNSNCDWACVPPQLLGFIELDDIANTPVPGNSVGDWNTFVNQGATQWSAEFTSVVVDVNKIEFYGVPQLNERLVLYPLVGTLNIVDYDFTGFEYVKELELVNVSGLSLFSFTSFPELVKSRTVYTDIVTYTFTSCINLEKIVIESSTVTTLDISTCSLLEEFYVVNCPLPDLDFSNNPLLFDIVFKQCTGAVNVDLTANLALINLEASGDFTALDVSNNTLLTSLSVSAPNLLSLDIDNLTVLTSLNIEGCTSVTTLDTSNNLLLITARIGLSGLLTYDPSSNTAFEQLWINDTVISTLDVSYNIALYYLNIRECPITTIDISANTLLSTFDAGYSDLTTADITDSVSWIGLGFRNCAITLDTDVNAILAHLVSIGFTGSLDIMGGTNAAPTGQGILDVATLIGNGASVITN